MAAIMALIKLVLVLVVGFLIVGMLFVAAYLLLRIIADIFHGRMI